MLTLTSKSLARSLVGRGLATAAPNSSFMIPVIDFSKFRRENGPRERQRTADEIVTAFRESGFIYLKNHGVSPSELAFRLALFT